MAQGNSSFITVWDNVLDNFLHFKSDMTQSNLLEQLVLCAKSGAQLPELYELLIIDFQG